MINKGLNLCTQNKLSKKSNTNKYFTYFACKTENMSMFEPCAQATIPNAQEMATRGAQLAAVILMCRDGSDVSTIYKYTTISPKEIGAIHAREY